MRNRRFSWETVRLKTIIAISKTIPKDLKGVIKHKIVNEFELSDISTVQGLFKNIVKENAYDLFTSSILAIHYRNWLSLEVLTRSQLEILLLTNWLVKNPHEVRDVFNREIHGNLKKFYKEEEKDKPLLHLWEVYNKALSKKAHPLPTRFLGSISFVRFMKPKKAKLDKRLFNREINKLPKEEREKIIDESFEYDGYSPGINTVPHKSKKKEKALVAISYMIYIYDRILEDLDSIERIQPKYKMKSDQWERAIRKYARE